MAGGLITLFHRLRARPMRERWILGLTTYITLTAVIIALWFTSLQNSLHLTPVPAESNRAAIAAGANKTSTETTESQITTPPASQPKTPFQVLKEAVSDTISAVKELRAEINQISPVIPLTLLKKEMPPVAAQSASPSSNKPKPIKVAKAGGPPEAKFAPGSPAEIVSAELKIKPYSTFALGRLVAPPQELMAKIESAPKSSGRISTIFYYNLGEMRQAAVDFYKYLTE